MGLWKSDKKRTKLARIEESEPHNNIPNKNIETPAAITLKSGLIQNPYPKIINIVGNKIFLNTIILLLTN